MLLIQLNLPANALTAISASDSAIGIDGLNSVSNLALTDYAITGDAIGVAVLGATIAAPQLGGLLPIQMRKWPKAEAIKPTAIDKQVINPYQQSVHDLVIDYKLEELSQGSNDGALAKEAVSVAVTNTQNDSARTSEILDVTVATTWADAAIAADSVAIHIELSESLNELANGFDAMGISKQLAPYVLQMQSLIINGFI